MTDNLNATADIADAVAARDLSVVANAYRTRIGSASRSG